MRNYFILRVILTAFTIILVSFLGFSKEETANSTWAPAPLKIDGNHAEWTGGHLNTYEKCVVDYAFKNDPEYLYVLFVFKDPRYISSINFTGMTIYFNTEGKKKKDYGVNFVKKQVTADEFIAMMEEKEDPIPEEKKSEIRMKSQYILHNIKVIGKVDKPVGQEAETGKARPAVFKTMKQQNMMVFEFAIPLKRLVADAPGVGTEPGKLVKLGFEWGGMTKDMKRAYMSQRAAAESGATERVSRFDTKDTSADTGHVVGDTDLPFAKTAKKYSFWVDVQLAKGQ